MAWLLCVLVLAIMGAVPCCFGAPAAPVLRWKYGGCYSSWCETAWYSSPAVVDLDGDGEVEIIASAYSIWALNGTDGSVKWRVKSGHDISEPEAISVGRTWPGIGIADIDGDSKYELISAHSGGIISVYNEKMEFEPGWPVQPFGTSSELRTLVVADLDGDGKSEILTGRASSGSNRNTVVLQSDGSIRPGWPQPTSDTSGYATGIYNDNLGVGNIDGNNGTLEVISPSDVHYVCAYYADGTAVIANSTLYPNRAWGKVGAYVDVRYELQGWGPCGTGAEYSPRSNFADGVANVVDMDGDGTNEIVVTGNVHDCSYSPYLDIYLAAFIFKGDRSRWVHPTQGNLKNWTQIPIDTGAPLANALDYNIVETVRWNPVTADLDLDGELEILFASYDGKLHAYWLDKTFWRFTVPAPDVFCSEPLVADLDGDGRVEVIITTWPVKKSNSWGHVIVLDGPTGSMIHRVELPAPKDTSDWSGAIAASTIARLDKSDGDMVLVVNTVHAGVVLFDLPGSSNAKLQWPTGRGNYRRSGTGVIVDPVFPSGQHSASANSSSLPTRVHPGVQTILGLLVLISMIVIAL